MFDKASLSQQSKAELLDIAKILNIKGRSLLSKDELIVAILKSQKTTESAKNKLTIQAAPAVHFNEDSSPNGQAAVSDTQKNPLPTMYNQDKLVLMVRDPYWGYAWWDISEETKTHFQFQNRNILLRISDITEIEFNGQNAHRFYDTEIGFARNWYVDFGVAGRNFIAEIGFYDESGQFIAILRSNIIQTPRDRVSDNIDETWMISDEDFERLFFLSGGLVPGLSSHELAQVGERKWSLTMHLSSESLSSFSLSSDALTSLFR